MFSWLFPHYHIERVEELTPERLRQLEIDALLVDVDCTLKRYRSSEMAPAVAVWIEAVRSQGIGFCLVSNGGKHRIRPFAESLDAPYVARALKPLPLLLKRTARRLGFAPQRTAMVGDQVLADIVAGRLAGMQAILVEPIRPEDEPWMTRLKRPLEQPIRRRVPVHEWGA